MDDGALARSNRVLRTLGAGHRALLRAADEQGLLESICNVLVEDGRYPIAWIAYVENDAVGAIRPVACAGREGAFVSATRLSRDAGPPSVTSEAIRAGRVAVGRDAGSDPLLDRWRTHTDRDGDGAIGAFPLRIDDTIVGSVTLVAAHANAFDESECRLLTELAPSEPEVLGLVARARDPVGACRAFR